MGGYDRYRRGLRFEEINLDELAKSLLPTYEESKEKINSFLNLDDDDEDEKPKKKKKKKSKKSDI